MTPQDGKTGKDERIPQQREEAYRMRLSQKRHLRSVNLNLLPILAELLRCSNVSLAAKSLHLTQSAVSAALKKLRLVFEDDLLVMSGREMVLTERARALLPIVEDIVNDVDELFTDDSFNPSTTVRSFHIVTADYATARFLALLGPTLKNEAPGISLTFSNSHTSVEKDMRLGFVDLMICPENLRHLDSFSLSSPTSDFDYTLLTEDRLVAIESRLRKRSYTPISVKEYLDQPHVAFRLTHDFDRSVEQEALAAKNLIQNEQITVPYVTLIPQLVVSMDLISLIPNSLATEYSKIYPIRIFEPPVKFPSLNLIMVWARNRRDDEGLQWLRKTISDIAADESEV